MVLPQIADRAHAASGEPLCVCPVGMQHVPPYLQRYCTVSLTLMLFAAVFPESIERPPEAAACLEMCRCGHNSRRVLCDFSNVTSVPITIPRGVQQLHLSHNRIADLSADVLSSYVSLRALYVDDNIISELHFDTAVLGLRFLSMSDNRIENISALALSGVAGLRVLDLGHNYIAYLHEQAFAALTSLRVLRLNANRLATIPPQLLANLPHLTSLDLSGNLLQRFDAGCLAASDSLWFLNLSSNVLTEIRADDANATPALRIVDLSYNRIAIIPGRLLTPSLRQLRLAANRIVCDCHAVPLRAWLRRQPTNTTAVVCRSPAALDGLNLADVADSRLRCAAPKDRRRSWLRFRRPRPNSYAYGYGAVSYDALLGWQTAATLSGMLVLFLLCLGADKLKRLYYKRRRHGRERRETDQYVTLLHEAHASRADVLNSIYCQKADERGRRSDTHLSALLQPATVAAAAAVVAASTGVTAAAICQLLAAKPAASAASLNYSACNTPAPTRNPSYESCCLADDGATTPGEVRWTQRGSGDGGGTTAVFTVGGPYEDVSPPGGRGPRAGSVSPCAAPADDGTGRGPGRSDTETRI